MRLHSLRGSIPALFNFPEPQSLSRAVFGVVAAVAAVSVVFRRRRRVFSAGSSLSLKPVSRIMCATDACRGSRTSLRAEQYDATIQVSEQSVGQSAETTKAVAEQKQILREVTNAFLDGSADWLSIGDVRRMLVATEGNAIKAVWKLEEAVRWKDGTLKAWLDAEAENLKTTETRVIALGHESRPLVYSGCVNQRYGEVASILVACVFDRALQQAGPTAQLDYVLDAHGWQPMLNLNMKPYLEVTRSLNSYFAERIHRIVLIDVPGPLAWLLKAITACFPSKTLNKMVFVERDDSTQMEELFELCVDHKMRKMLEELIQMNGRASSSADREATHDLTNAFLESQLAQSRHA